MPTRSFLIRDDHVVLLNGQRIVLGVTIPKNNFWCVQCLGILSRIAIHRYCEKPYLHRHFTVENSKILTVKKLVKRRFFAIKLYCISSQKTPNIAHTKNHIWG